MAMQHKGSPSNAPSSAPESGTVRDQSDNKAPVQQQKFQKRRPGQNETRQGSAKQGRS